MHKFWDTEVGPTNMGFKSADPQQPSTINKSSRLSPPQFKVRPGCFKIKPSEMKLGDHIYVVKVPSEPRRVLRKQNFPEPTEVRGTCYGFQSDWDQNPT